MDYDKKAINDYNIPRKIRELQSSVFFENFLTIITYQEKLGNYNSAQTLVMKFIIITYQEKLGNYNCPSEIFASDLIITYQEKLGNYNGVPVSFTNVSIITYQEKLGNYNYRTNESIR